MSAIKSKSVVKKGIDRISSANYSRLGWKRSISRWGILSKLFNISILVSMIATSCLPSTRNSNLQSDTDKVLVKGLAPLQVDQFPEFTQPISKQVERTSHPEDKINTPQQVAQVNDENVFIQNVGQFNESVKYVAYLENSTVYFSENSIWYVRMEPQEIDETDPEKILDRQLENKPRNGTIVRVDIPTNNENITISPSEKAQIKVSYFLGNNKDGQLADVPVWNKLTYSNIYPGMDLEISSDGTFLLWNFTIKVFSEFAKSHNQIFEQGIVLNLLGQQGIETKDTIPFILTPYGDIPFSKIFVNDKKVTPSIGSKGEQIVIPLQKMGSQFSVTSFSESKSYNNNFQTSSGLLFARLYGSEDGYDSAWGTAITQDGSIIVTGDTDAPLDFDPTATGNIQAYGNEEIFVLKINPNGSTEFLTILGGNGNELGEGIELDNSGNIYISGVITSPSNFPIVGNAVSSSGKGFLIKLSSDGSQILYSTRLGDSTYADLVNLDVDDNGNAYILDSRAGATYTGKVYKIIPGDPNYGYVHDLGSGIWADIEVNGSGQVYISGRAVGSGADAYLKSLSDSGNLLFSTSIEAGSGWVEVGGIALDTDGYVYLVGDTSYYTNLPLLGSSITPKAINFSPSSFVAIYDSSLSLVYSSYIDLAASQFRDVDVDDFGNIYISGMGWSSAYFPFTSGAISTGQGDQDIFLIRLDAINKRQSYQISYATLMGGTEQEWLITPGDLVAQDNNGNVYVAGDTPSSEDFTGVPSRGYTYSTNLAFVVRIATGPVAAPPTTINELTTVTSSSDACFSASISGTQGNVAAPINTRTGGYDYSINDISIPTSAGTLSFQREYATPSIGYPTTLSTGWTYNHDTHLILPTDPGGQPNTILFKAHTANQYLFTINGDGTYSPYPGLCATLTEDPSGFTLKDGGQKTYSFDTSGKLLSYEDAEGHTWNYIYNPSGTLSQINADGGSRYLSLQYDGQGRIYRVTDHTGRFVEYGYNANGDLDSADDVLGQTWTYEYDPTLSHYLTRVAAPGNVTVEETDFYPDGKAWKQYDGEGNQVVELVYNPDGTTTITDALGNISTHTYDERGTLVSQDNSAGGGQDKVYDNNFRPEIITDGNGNPTNLTWSADGVNLTKIVDALTGETDITYGALNNPTNIIDPLNYETKYYYEDTNFPTLPTKIEYPLSFDGGATYIHTTYQYYEPGNPEGQPEGKLKLMTDELGHQTLYTYTSSGQIETVTTAYGTPESLTTSNLYDNLGNLIEQTDSTGLKTRYGYDDANRVIQITRNYDPAHGQNYLDKFNIVTEYQYDSRGNQIATTDTNGIITRTYYDSANRPVTVVENLTGQSIQTITPPTGGTGTTDENIRTDTVYDIAGNVIATIGPAGIITRIYYDSANRPVTTVQNLTGQSISDPNPPTYSPASPDQNVRTDTAYDLNGNAIATTDTLGTITRTYYDQLNRPVTVVQNLTGQGINVTTAPGRGTTSNLRTDMYYDANGNAIATQDPNGIITRTYYNALNRPVTVVKNLSGQTIGTTTPPAAGTGETEINLRSDTYYDQAGNAIATVDPRGMVTRTYYDSANRPVTIVQNLVGQDIYLSTPPARGSAGSDENVRVDIVYDLNGRRNSTVDPLGRVTKYEYDEVGQVIKVTGNFVNGGIPQNDQNQRNIVTEYTYDIYGRQIEVTDTLGNVDTTAYDDLGRLLATTKNYQQGQPQNYKDGNGDQFNIVTSYLYDVLGRQIAATDTADVVTRTYYDGLSRPVTVVRNLTGYDPSITTPPARQNPSSSTDNLRMDTVYLGNGTVDYIVDEMGETTDYTYDPTGRLTAILDPLLKQTSFDYDANGNRTTMQDAEGVYTRYEYDGPGRLTAVVENYQAGVNPDNETNVRTEYTYDANSNRRSILDGKSHSTFFTYTAFNLLQSETDALGNTNVYGYDAIGNRISLLDANGVTTLFGYDELNRIELIDYTGSDPDVSFDYDPLGRRSTMVDGAGTTSWDYNNLDLPKSITDPFSSLVSYDYDSLGNRTSLTYPSTQTVTYTYDPNNRLTDAFTNGLGNTHYEYDALGRIKTVDRPNGVDSSYNYHTNGWLQDLIHSSGATALASYQYQYDEVGNRIQVIEDVSQPAMVYSPEKQNPNGNQLVAFGQEPISFTNFNSVLASPSDTPTPTEPPTETATPDSGNTTEPEPSFTATPTPEATVTLEATQTAQETPTNSPSNENALIVNSNGDDPDSDLNDGKCNDGSGVCTLRAAIEQANADPGLDRIYFDLSDENLTIQPESPLPFIEQKVLIDGTSQSGYAGMPLVVLDGSLIQSVASGLHVTGGQSVIKGLVVNNFNYAGIFLDGKNGNKIEGNFIGTNAAGDSAQGNRNGILIVDSNGNQIGGATPQKQNLISGNLVGVYIIGEKSKGNQIHGNLIGTDITGEKELGNDIGVRIKAAINNSIGGDKGENKNRFSGNLENLAIPGDLVQNNALQQGLQLQPPPIPSDPILEEQPAGQTTEQQSSNPVQIVNSEPSIVVNNDSLTISPVSFLTTSNPAPLAVGTTFVVDSILDGSDKKLNDGVCKTAQQYCSLRAAIQQANASPDLDTIVFNINPSQQSNVGTYIIKPNNSLPVITSPVIIDGTTQPGFSGLPIIELDGTSAGASAIGLHINTSSSVVKGLAIFSFDLDGIRISYQGNNLITGNHIGTTSNSDSGKGNYDGIVVVHSSNNTIGGTTASTRNVISGNESIGLYFGYSDNTGNVAQGNYIGLDSTGTSALPNDLAGVYLYDTPGNTIGGTAPGAGNVISGNIQNGIYVYAANSINNVFQGNLIGTDPSGTSLISNGSPGIMINLVSGGGNLIGGNVPGAGNLISGNQFGIYILNTTGSTQIYGNKIGTDITGAIDFGNTYEGIMMYNSSNSIIGSTIDNFPNLISGNDRVGVWMYTTGGNNNIVQGNIIGLDATGSSNLGNSSIGVAITSGSNNIIGGQDPSNRNIISGNGGSGVIVTTVDASGNQILNNYIGTDITGTLSIGNGLQGVHIDYSSNNSVTGNLITASGTRGIRVVGTATGNDLSGNLIWDNVELGIDIGELGISPNDAGDVDTGSNNVQNFPVLTSAVGGENTTITGSLNSTADTTFRLEFFSNPACDSSGYGEGQVYLGSTMVTTDSNGDVAFNTTLSASSQTGEFISGTATDPGGNTSEFSLCLEVGSTVSSGPVTIDYTYDPLYRLKTADYSTGDYYHYTYDEVGNRLTQDTMVSGLQTTTTYTYDNANRLQTANGVTYTFDDNGNLLSDGVNTYAYDSANRLTSVNGTDFYTYNGLGDRLTQNGTQYTLDLNTGLTQVLNDGTNDYIYGLGRIAQTNVSTTDYFLGDALGSVRQLTDPSGQLTYASGYDPYGNLAYSGGTSQTSYGFTGENTDPNGLVYLRARYYNPLDGRFMSRDMWEGSSNQPHSLNRWNYTLSNPTNYVDPSGFSYEPPQLFPSQLCGASTLSFGTATLTLSAIELINLCKEFYSQSTWRNFSLPGGIGNYDCETLNSQTYTKPISARELYGDYICERGPDHVYFNGQDILSQKLAQSIIINFVRKKYYKDGFFDKEVKFGNPIIYAIAWTDLLIEREFPLMHILGSIDVVIKPAGQNRIQFQVDNRTDMASGTHFVGRFPPEGQEDFPLTLERFIQSNPDKANSNALQLIMSNKEIVAILSPQDRTGTIPGMGGGNFRQTFTWTEDNVGCYIHLPWPTYLMYPGLNIGP